MWNIATHPYSTSEIEITKMHMTGAHPELKDSLKDDEDFHNNSNEAKKIPENKMKVNMY
jgi:hypothetical protein